MDTTTAPTDPVLFEAPGPGFWEMETTHHGLRPLTPFLREAYRRAFEEGIEPVLSRYGLPLASIRAELVHGCFYVRPLGVGERADAKPKAPPPAWFMKILVRLHPEMRRRAKAASQAWEGRLWRDDVDRWFDHDRADLTQRNIALQAVDLSTLDDGELAVHLAELLDHFETNARRNLETHGGDLIPTGDLMAHCEGWGIGAGEAADLLRGSSPATVETAHILGPVACALAAADEVPSSLEGIRNLGPEVAGAIDEWLGLHAWRLLTSDDVDRPTLAEMPALQVSALLSAVDDERAEIPPDVDSVRSRVPSSDRALFDGLLEEARYGNRQRDDIRGVCWNWPGGLVRRGLLEVGRRLVARGAVSSAEQAVELFPDELTGLLVDGVGPTAEEIARRGVERDRVEAAPPPRTFGDPETPPPLDAFPAAMARATAALMTNLTADGTAENEPLQGAGVGSESYRGRACVTSDAADALERLQPGDVLIAAFTGPSINSVLPIVGAIVVEEGGVICHAAVVAREFGIPAVVGAAGATTLITDGSTVEVDPTTGVVRMV